jgi:hypothetical protein
MPPIRADAHAIGAALPKLPKPYAIGFSRQLIDREGQSGFARNAASTNHPTWSKSKTG